MDATSSKAGARRFGPLLLAILAACPAAGLASIAAKSWDFEADAPGAIARGFTGEVGAWVVDQDGGNRVLSQTASSDKAAFNLALVEGTNFQDLDLSVRLIAREGEIDQGGGLVWRARDGDNYYIARYNPLEDNLRLYKVEAGKRTQLDHAGVPGDRDWHTLRIAMTGRAIVGYLDGRKLLEAEDATFPAAGRIGLWSKADARTSFDDLEVSP